MPQGVVQWFDPDAGEGRILHGGRRYAVRTDDIEPEARVAGARVHFDIDGPDARAVELRTGSPRVSKRQRRFGDLTGAGRVDAKGTAPFASAQPELALDLQRHPERVVQQWVDAVGAGDLDRAMLLYVPGASLHAGGTVLLSPAAIRRHWEGSPLPGGSADDVQIRGYDGEFVVRWDSGGDDVLRIRFRVAHGEIAEQHVRSSATAEAEPPTTSEAERDLLPVEVSTSGPVDGDGVDYTIAKVRKAVEVVGDPVLHVDVRLVHSSDPSRERPATAKATVDVDGEPVRAQVSATTTTEAADLLEARLRARFEQLATHRKALRKRGPGSGSASWRHGDPGTERPDHHPRPVEEREIVRHKSFEPDEVTLDEAVFDLEAMDHDFCLFHDLATGQDALVHRDGSGYRVHYQRGPGAEAEELPTAAPVAIDPNRAPSLDIAEARERLDTGGERFVFFEDADTARGHVLYRRYDGHYGLLVPIDEDVDLRGDDRSGRDPAGVG